MSDLLDELRLEWKENPEYSDVQAEYWTTGNKQIERCPNGCRLEIYEDSAMGWVPISGRDAYRQTRICRKHGFAIIYVKTGPTSRASKDSHE